MHLKKYSLAYMFMLPAFSMILLFFLLPVVLTFIFSFTTMSSSTGITSKGTYMLSVNTIKQLTNDGMPLEILEKINNKSYVITKKNLTSYKIFFLL